MSIKAKDLKNEGVKLKLNGKQIEIKCNLNVFCELENIYSNPDEIFEALGKGSLKAIRGIIWANYKTIDPNITPEEVGAMIDFKDIDYISDIIVQSIDRSMPDVENEDESMGE